jgi:hypothetical protein
LDCSGDISGYNLGQTNGALNEQNGRNKKVFAMSAKRRAQGHFVFTIPVFGQPLELGGNKQHLILVDLEAPSLHPKLKLFKRPRGCRFLGLTVPDSSAFGLVWPLSEYLRRTVQRFSAHCQF